MTHTRLPLTLPHRDDESMCTKLTTAKIGYLRVSALALVSRPAIASERLSNEELEHIIFFSAPKKPSAL